MKNDFANDPDWPLSNIFHKNVDISETASVWYTDDTDTHVLVCTDELELVSSEDDVDIVDQFAVDEFDARCLVAAGELVEC